MMEIPSFVFLFLFCTFPYHFKLGNFAFLHHLIWVKKRILVGSDKKTSPNSVSDLEIEVKVEIMYAWPS